MSPPRCAYLCLLLSEGRLSVPPRPHPHVTPTPLNFTLRACEHASARTTPPGRNIIVVPSPEDVRALDAPSEAFTAHLLRAHVRLHALALQLLPVHTLADMSPETQSEKKTVRGLGEPVLTKTGNSHMKHTPQACLRRRLKPECCAGGFVERVCGSGNAAHLALHHHTFLPVTTVGFLLLGLQLLLTLLPMMLLLPSDASDQPLSTMRLNTGEAVPSRHAHARDQVPKT